MNNNMDEIPDEDGFYWVKLGRHDIFRLYTEKDKYLIIKLRSEINQKTGKRTKYITFLGPLVSIGSRTEFTLTYFLNKVEEFGDFIPIVDPNY